MIFSVTAFRAFPIMLVCAELGCGLRCSHGGVLAAHGSVRVGGLRLHADTQRMFEHELCYQSLDAYGRASLRVMGKYC